MVNVIVQSGGTSGPRGNSVLSGTRTPLVTDGIDGDFWVNTTDPSAPLLYGPRAAGVWPSTGLPMTSSAAGALLAANNLSDLANPATARTNLGLGTAATRNVGTTSGTVAAGDDSRITGALQSGATAGGDLSGTLPNPTVAKVNGVAVSGIPTAGQVPTATSGTAATWQTPAAAPGASGTVTSETSFGQASAAGAAGTFSRGDHTHGTPTLPAASTSVAGVVQLDGTATDIQPLGTQAAGAVGKAADAGHVHAMPRLDQVQAPTAAVALNSQKITGLANGAAATDAAAVGQLPGAATTGATGLVQLAGDLSGTATSPQVTGTHLAAPLPVGQGGTGAASASAGLAALGGTPISTVRQITASSVAANAWDVIEANCTSNAITVTPPANATGLRFTVKKTDATSNPVTISATVDGVASPTIAIANQAWTIVGDGSNWYTIAQGGNPDGGALYPPSLRLPRYPQPAAILTDFQAGHGFTSDGGTFTANDTSTYVRGTQCATLTTPGDGVTYHVSGSVSSYDTTSRIPRVTVQVVDITKLLGLTIDLCTDTTWSNGWSWSMQGGASGSNYLTSGDWVTQTLSFHDAVKIGSGARSGLGAVRFRITDEGVSNPVTVHLQGVDLVADGTATWPNGVVSITFDDSYQDAIDNGKARLDLYGYPATTFVIADRIGVAGRLTLNELKQLQDDDGWELSSHAYLDADHGATFTGLTSTQLDADARQMKAYAVQNGFRAADLVANPKGQYGLTTDGVSTTAILRKYFAAGLTTVNKTKETYPPSDAFRIRRISSISSFSGGYQPASLTQAGGDLDLCKANGSWLILAFHEVVTSAPTAATQILQSDYNAIIDGINSRGIQVVPVGEVLRYASVTSTATATIDTTDLPKKAGTPAATGSGPLASPWDHVHPRTYWTPEDHGLISWTWDPAIASNSQSMGTAGTLGLARIHVPVATTVANVCLYLVAAGTSLTSGQCFAALYTSGGSLLAATADQSAAWASNGLKTMALTSAQSVAAGDYYVAWYWNGTTAPTLLRGVGNSSINLNLSSTVARYATGATGLTTAMPASAGTFTGLSAAVWAGVS